MYTFIISSNPSTKQAGYGYKQMISQTTSLLYYKISTSPILFIHLYNPQNFSSHNTTWQLFPWYIVSGHPIILMSASFIQEATRYGN